MAQLVFAAAVEAAIGATIGYAARLIFAGIQIGAFHIAQQMGLSLSQVFDPLGEDSSDAVSQLAVMLGIVIFLAIGGHRALIGAMMRTYQVLPAGEVFAGVGIVSAVTALLTSSFVLALKVAAPALVTFLVLTAALGFLQRTLPQCHILSVGLPIRAAVGLLVLAGGLWVMQWVIQDALRLTLIKLAPITG